MSRSVSGLTMGHCAGVWVLVKGALLSAVFCPLLEGRTSQTVSKPGLLLNQAGRGDQMVAHKTRFINGLYRAHSVRPYSTHPDYLGFETAWSVRPYFLLV